MSGNGRCICTRWTRCRRPGCNVRSLELRPRGHACRHNETYWAGDEYYAAGPGAARYVEGRREVNHRSYTTWMRRVLAGQSPVAECERLEPEDRAREALMLGLRRTSGVSTAAFRQRFGFDPGELIGASWTTLATAGLWEAVERDDGDRQLRLTSEGLLVSDSIWPLILRE